MHAGVALIPVALLVAAMAVRAPRLRLPLPAHIALPGAAVLALLVHPLGRGETDGVLLAARVIEGLLTSLMPLSIVFGAILLFDTLRASGAMTTITRALESAVRDPVHRVVLIAWSFSYLVEGLSGFGTPAALAAPLLVGLGYPPMRAAAVCLVLNSVPVVFGAVGTPMWFGFGEIGLDADAVARVGLYAAALQWAMAPVVLMAALRLLFEWSEIRARWRGLAFVLGCTLAGSTMTALASVEFPSIAGGLCALAASFVLARADVPAAEPPIPTHDPPLLSLRRALTPIVACVVLLAITRIEPLGLRALLTSQSPRLEIPLGPLGDATVSAALVASLDRILGTPIGWSMPVLYVPFVIPFVVVVLACGPLLRMRPADVARVTRSSCARLLRPAVALAGALVFVKVMMHGGATAPVAVIGGAFASVVAAVDPGLWFGAAPALGALGSFFSGSATVSNLTFGPVQASAAEQLALELPVVLALQSLGAAAGNMVCIHNIVAVAAVLGLGARTSEGKSTGDPVGLILQTTARPVGVLLGTALVIAGVYAVLRGA